MHIVKPLIVAGAVAATAGIAIAVAGQGALKPSVPPPSDPATRRVAAATASFGLSLTQDVAANKSSGNVFLSPFSISQALSLALNGAAGNTQVQIRRTLLLGDMSLSDVNKANGELLPSLVNPDPKVSLSIANALWANRGVTLNPGFVKRCHTYYQAKSATLDFDKPSGAKTINDWVARNTHGKIPAIVTAEAIRSQPAVLTNAIYFHGRWSHAFERSNTADSDFTLQNGTKRKLPLMHRTGPYSYLATDRFQAVRIPYGQGRFAMYVFLPKSVNGLNAFVKSARPLAWNSWIAKMRPTEVALSLPRFKASQSILLNDPLKRLGMPAAFSDRADFSPMGLRGAYIGAVIHKATLEVDEQGTVAAAATGIVMTSAAVALPTEIRIDHPFFCAIRDDATGALLFTGAVRNPE